MAAGAMVVLANMQIQPGRAIFQALSALALGYALCAGVVFTADSLSEERREGTLGLLFLTPLKGGDVVLGKLATNSIYGFCGMIAALPMLAVPVLMGGVTIAEMAKITALLLNTLFLSLAAGLFASSMSRQKTKSMIRAATVILAVSCGGWPLPFLWYGMKYYPHPEKAQSGQTKWIIAFALSLPLLYFTLLLPSPVYAFYLVMHPQSLHADAWYVASLSATHLVSWLFLAGAARLARQILWEAPREPDTAEERESWTQVESSGVTSTETVAQRAQMLARNPVCWLACRDRRMETAVWLAVYALILGMLTGVSLASPRAAAKAPSAHALFVLLPYWGIQFLLAVQACRVFVEARRSGTLELLMVTPLGREEILQGQWAALERLLGRPFWVLSGIQGIIALSNILLQRSWAPPLTCLQWMLMMVTDFFALGWTSLWLGWSAKRPAFAAWLSFLHVILLPELLFTLFTLVLLSVSPITSPSHGPLWSLESLSYLLFDLGKNGAFVLWARRRVLTALSPSCAGAMDLLDERASRPQQ